MAQEGEALEEAHAVEWEDLADRAVSVILHIIFTDLCSGDTGLTDMVVVVLAE